MTEMLTSDELLARALSNQGVRFVFWHPGGANFPYYRALSECADISPVLVRHEVGACHMADGYARTTGQPGVVMLTAGAGAANSITGIANAYMDSVPIIVICGRDSPDIKANDQFDETDMVGVSRPVVKHSYVVRSATDIPRVVQEAVYVATTGRPGPVVIDIPSSASDSNTRFEYIMPESISLRGYRPAESGHLGQIKKALDAILNSSRPVIYAGGGVVHGDAALELQSFADCMNLPITTSLMGLGSIPGTHELSLGMLGLHGSHVANRAVANSDLILALGARFDDRVTNDPTQFCPQARVIHVDIDPASISKVIKADLPVVGPCKQVLARLHELALGHKEPSSAESNRFAPWWEQINQWRKETTQQESVVEVPGDSAPIRPQEVVRVLHEESGGNAFVTTDVGQHQMFVAQGYTFSTPRRWVTPGGLGTMGFGLPAAIGVQFAHPDATVICVTGESSFLVNLQELSTCRQYGLPIKVICLNNGTLGMVKQWSVINDSECELSGYRESMPDLVHLVESFGHRALRATTDEELQHALTIAFSDECRFDTVFVDVTIDPNILVLPTLKRGGTLNETITADRQL